MTLTTPSLERKDRGMPYYRLIQLLRTTEALVTIPGRRIPSKSLEALQRASRIVSQVTVKGKCS
jgi:hypothetical protein